MDVEMKGAGRASRAALMVVLTCASAAGNANVLMYHGQGEAGTRQLYFANLSSIADRTPMDDVLGSTSVFEMEVLTVYEDAKGPDWSATKLQFECPAPAAPQWPGARKKKQTEPASPRPLRWRVGNRSYQLTRDANEVPIAPTAWAPVTDQATAKAGLLACNEVTVRDAVRSGGGSSGIDNAKLNASLAPIGIGEVAWVQDTVNFLGLRTLAWNQLWKRERPKGQADRQLTAAELAKSNAALSGVGKEMSRLNDEANAFAKPRLEAHEAEQEFLAQVARVRGGRQVTQLESSMLMVWLAKPEELVATRLGANPRLSQVGNLRFISYSNQSDTRSATVSAASGRVIQQHGAFAACTVSFVLAQDSKSVWRVADIRIESEGPAGSLCRSLLNTPEGGTLG